MSQEYLGTKAPVLFLKNCRALLFATFTVIHIFFCYTPEQGGPEEPGHVGDIDAERGECQSLRTLTPSLGLALCRAVTPLDCKPAVFPSVRTWLPPLLSAGIWRLPSVPESLTLCTLPNLLPFLMAPQSSPGAIFFVLNTGSLRTWK